MKRRARVGLLCAVLASCRGAGGDGSGEATAPAGPSSAAVDAGGDTAVVVIEKTAIRVGGREVVKLPPLADQAQTGVEAKHKRSANPNELYIVPLAQAVAPARAADKAAHPQDPSVALVIADPATPYRVFVEVLFTLGQSEFGRYRLLAQGETRAPRVTVPPKIERDEALQKRQQKALNLSIFIVGKGISVKASGGNMAPGCVDHGTGITVPRAAAGHDLDGLAACAERLKGQRPEYAEETQVTLTANPDVDFATVTSVMDALRTRGGKELFPEVHFGVAR